MQQIALLNRRGLTLVEVMIALVVFLFVFFALMQTALVSIDANMMNSLRNEALNIAEMRMNEARNENFVGLVSDAGAPSGNFDSSCDSGCNDCPAGFATGRCSCRDVRSISQFKFCTNLTCTEVVGGGGVGGDGNCATDDAENKQVHITVGWKWKGEDYTHRITTVRKR
jgi:prepilin-type N-terminal cleavage/methylation domain-containing protein